MAAGLTVKGCLGWTAYRDQALGSGVPRRTGNTYIESGSAFCTSGPRRNSTKALAPSGSAAPVRTPAYSTWRKQVSSRAFVVEADPPFGTVNAGDES